MIVTSQIFPFCAALSCEYLLLRIVIRFAKCCKISTMVQLTVLQKAKIVVLWEQDQPIKKIARDMGVTVCKLIRLMYTIAVLLMCFIKDY